MINNSNLKVFNDLNKNEIEIFKKYTLTFNGCIGSEEIF